jgi:hypothetical protein
MISSGELILRLVVAGVLAALRDLLSTRAQP